MPQQQCTEEDRKAYSRAWGKIGEKRRLSIRYNGAYESIQRRCHGDLTATLRGCFYLLRTVYNCPQTVGTDATTTTRSGSDRSPFRTLRHGGDTALDGTTTHPSNSGERKRNDEASTDMMQRSCNGVDSGMGMGMRMNHFPFAGGSKTGKVGGMDPESAGTGRTVRGRGRDWVPLRADGLGWVGEKLGDQSHDTLM
ncbi:hypothetical protein V496_06359 [Pseudogymnoascus sp. VKM F-4515 (FW-2607)]|nr:hypothetical protein V496_06359 [Pseudogymnoascus sp. VKM F-4515 (FW-2607)]